MKILDNFKQRKLFQWTVAYLAGAWLLMQLVGVLGAHWDIPDYTARVVDVVLMVGFFVTLVIAWYHGDKGRQRVSGPELLIIAALLGVGGLGLGLLGGDKTKPEPTGESGNLVESTDETPWIAVLPFKVQTDDPDLRSFAGGLTEDISNGLSDFSCMLVLSRNTDSGLAAGSVDVRQIIMGTHTGVIIGVLNPMMADYFADRCR